jgi:CRISPR-associated exonuclease Cas4
MNKKAIDNIYNMVKKGIENYRAATDAVPKTDVYDIIEETFNSIMQKEDDALSVEEVSGCLREAYFERKDPIERTQKQMLETIIQRGILNVLAKPVKGEIYVQDKKIKLIGIADRVDEDVVIIFRMVKELPEMPFVEHFVQINAYLHMFNKEEGVIVYFDNDGNEIEFIVPKNEGLFKETLRRAKILDMLLRNNIVPALEPSNKCTSCPYNERCYYPSEDKERIGFWVRGRWVEARKQQL